MILTKVHEFITNHGLITPGDKIVIGLSGGPDSVFLMHLFAKLKEKYSLTLLAAHLNHEWRADAHQDVEFCRTLAHMLSIPFITTRAGEISLIKQPNGSQEEHGRLLRRQFFEQCALSDKKIALAHHRDDQYETFFIRLLRGASLTGLASIKPHHGNYIRPLLCLSKAEIVTYLTQNNIAYLTDPTNTSDAYLRNNIRAQVIPALRSCDERFDTTFERTIEQLQETDRFLENLTTQMLQTITHKIEGQTVLDLIPFANLDPVLQQRLMLAWLCQEQVAFTPSQGFLQETLRFLCAPQGGTHQLNVQWSLHKKKNWALIVKGMVPSVMVPSPSVQPRDTKRLPEL